MSPDRALEGRKTMILGASSEGTHAIALALAAEGVLLALTTRTSDAEEAYNLRRFARKITDTGATCLHESADMSLGTSVQVTIRQTSKALEGIDYGIVAPELRLQKAAERTSDSEWVRVVNGNLSAAFFACRGLGREMLDNEGEDKGRIIVLLPLSAGPDEASFAGAVAGTEGLVKAIAAEWRDKGVMVNAVVAGEDGREHELTEKVLWLLSPEAAGVTGQRFEIGSQA